MHLITDPTTVVMVDEATPNPVPLREGQSRIDRARSRGAIRVGFVADNLPFTFVNAAGDLVGFEIEMAHQLAADLGVTLELVPVTYPDDMAVDLLKDHCDLIMAGVGASVSHYLEVPFTRSYIELTPALVVPDHMRNKVDTIEEIRRARGLRVGVVNDPDIVRLARQQLPEADIVEIARVADYFRTEVPAADVVVISAEAGSAWTLLYPDYQVVVPFRRDVRWPLGYPVAPRDDRLLRFLDLWIDLKKDDGTIARLHDHWVLGQSAVTPVERWSVIKDVLHWVS
jgi:ABC-type amino acid transport substrate-binding protein